MTHLKDEGPTSSGSSAEHEDAKAVVIQEHSGTGDNISRDKIVIEALKAHNLAQVVRHIFEDIRLDRESEAQRTISTLQKIGGQTDESTLLLEALTWLAKADRRLSLSCKNELLAWIKNGESNGAVRDAVMAILMLSDVFTNLSSARHRYIQLEVKGPLSSEVYFQYLATDKEITEAFQIGAVDRTHEEFFGLVRGAWRLGKFELAVPISEHLASQLPGPEAEMLKAASAGYQLLHALSAMGSISYVGIDEKNQLDTLVDRLVALHPTSRIKCDDLIAALYSFYGFSHSGLETLVSSNKALKNQLHDLADESVEAKEIISSTIIDINLFPHLYRDFKLKRLEFSEIQCWIDEGGQFKGGESFLQNFAYCILLSEVCCETKKEAYKSKLKACIAQIKSNEDQSVNEFDVRYMYELCINLIHAKLTSEVVNLLESAFPQNAWVSPLYERYLEALCSEERFATFFGAIHHLSVHQKSETVLILEAQVYGQSGRYDEATESLKRAIEINELNPFAWRLLLEYLVSAGATEALLDEELGRIPSTLFDEHSKEKEALLYFWATHYDAEFAETVAVDWFLRNPHKMAKFLSTLHFGGMLKSQKLTGRCYNSRYGLVAVTYTDEFSTETKILVKNIDINHDKLIDESTALGRALKSLPIGEQSGPLSIGTITVTKREPVSHEAIRLAISLRSSQNDGTDPFRLFTLPSEPGQMVKQFERIAASFGKSESPEAETEIEISKMPMFIQGHYSHPDSPIAGAIRCISSSESHKYFGRHKLGLKHSREIILDAYSITYLCLLEMASAAEKADIRFYVDAHTLRTLTDWLEGRCHSNLSFIYEEDRLSKIDLSVFKGQLARLKSILKIATLEDFDTPKTLVQIRSLFDPSVYSSWRLSIGFGMPWLCIDPMIAKVSTNMGYLVEDTHAFLDGLIGLSSEEEKIRSLNAALLLEVDYPVQLNAINKLAQIESTDSRYSLLRILCMLTKEDLEKIGSLDLLVKTILQVSLDNPIQEPGCDYRASIVYRCMHLASLHLNRDTAEARVAMLLYRILRINSLDMNQRTRILQWAQLFITGRFLNREAIEAELNRLRAQTGSKNSEII